MLRTFCTAAQSRTAWRANTEPKANAHTSEAAIVLTYGDSQEYEQKEDDSLGIAVAPPA